MDKWMATVYAESSIIHLSEFSCMYFWQWTWSNIFWVCVWFYAYYWVVTTSPHFSLLGGWNQFKRAHPRNPMTLCEPTSSLSVIRQSEVYLVYLSNFKFSYISQWYGSGLSAVEWITGHWPAFTVIVTCFDNAFGSLFPKGWNITRLWVCRRQACFHICPNGTLPLSQEMHCQEQLSRCLPLSPLRSWG